MEKLLFLFFKTKNDRQSDKIYKSISTPWLIVALFTFALATNHAKAQESSLIDEYIQIGLDSNLQLQSTQLDIDRSLEALKQAKAFFKPQIDFQASYTLAQGGRTIAFPIGDLLNPVYSTLNQLIGTSQFPQIDNVSEQFLPHNFHETKFRIIQPLFNTDIYYGYKAKTEMVSVQQAKREVYVQELIKDIQLAYFQVLQAKEAIKVYQDTQELLEEVLRVNQRLVANGKATNETVYGTEYEKSRTEQALQAAENQHKVARAYFNFLLNRELETEVILDESLLIGTMPFPSLEEAEMQAMENREELVQLQGAMNAQTQVLEMQKARAFPSVTLVGDLGYQGFGYTFDNSQDFWLLQLSLKWTIFKGGMRRSEMQQVKIDQQVLQNQYAQLEQQIRLQVKQAYYHYQTALKSIQTARIGIKSAQRQYEITKRKHEEGQVPAFQLFDAQTKYTTAQLSYTLATYDLLSKQAILKRTIVGI